MIEWYQPKKGRETMKKLTAGIFTVLLGLVSINSAEAAVASKDYVDVKVNSVGGNVSTLTQTVTDLSTTVENNKTAAEDALKTEKEAREAADDALDTRVASAEGKITTLQGDKTVEGSVAKSIADAIAGEDLTNKFAAKEDVSNKASQITEGMDKAQMYPTVSLTESLISGANQGMSDLIGAVENGKTVVGMIAEGDNALAQRVTNIEESDYATSGVKATTVAQVDTNKTDIAGIKAEQTTQNSDIGTLKETVAKLDGNGEGSVAKQIETVTQKVTQVETDYKAADAALDTKLTKAISDGDTATLNAAKAVDAEQTTAITIAYQAADTALKTELQGYADKAEADAITTAGTNADTKISNLNLAALSRVPVDCQDPDSFCVLTAKGGQFYWEAIERATGEEQPAGTAIPAVTQ